MTTPKNPEQIMEELNEMLSPKARIVHDPNGGSISAIHWDKPSPTSESVQTWLRSSMASLLCYIAERMQIQPGDDYGYSTGIEKAESILIEEARRILEK